MNDSPQTDPIETPTRDIVIQGISLTLPDTYIEGQSITKAEANALNQVRAENIRNNQASVIKKELKEFNEAEGNDVVENASVLPKKIINKLIRTVLAYAEEYQFDMRSARVAGSGGASPLDRMCHKIAREYLMAQFKETGTTLAAASKVDEDAKAQINDKIDELAKHPEIVKLAEQNLAEQVAKAERLKLALAS